MFGKKKKLSRKEKKQIEFIKAHAIPLDDPRPKWTEKDEDEYDKLIEDRQNHLNNLFYKILFDMTGMTKEEYWDPKNMGAVVLTPALLGIFLIKIPEFDYNGADPETQAKENIKDTYEVESTNLHKYCEFLEKKIKNYEAKLKENNIPLSDPETNQNNS